MLTPIMKFLQPAFCVFLSAGALAASGCIGLSIKPPKPSGMPRAESASALKVGIHMKKPRFEWQGMGGMNTAYMEKHRERWMFKPMLAQSDDVGGKFLRALQAASAFSQVEEVKSVGFHGTGGDHDLIIEADFSGKYTQDPAGMGKAMATGFLLLLPAPFIRYDDAFFAAAEMAVYDRTGRLLHKYSERQDVATSAALFSAGTPGSIIAGIDAAASGLASKLVAALIADRAGYERALSAAPAVAARRRAAIPPPEPVPDPEPAPATATDDVMAAPLFAAAAAPVSAPAASSMFAPAAAPVEASSSAEAAEFPASEPAEAAEAKPEPKPARRGPLTPAEESAIDEQLMP